MIERIGFAETRTARWVVLLSFGWVATFQTGSLTLAGRATACDVATETLRGITEQSLVVEATRLAKLSGSNPGQTVVLGAVGCSSGTEKARVTRASVLRVAAF